MRHIEGRRMIIRMRLGAAVLACACVVLTTALTASAALRSRKSPAASPAHAEALHAAKTIRLDCIADTAIYIRKSPSSNNVYRVNYGRAGQVAFHGIHYNKDARDSAYYFLVDFDTTAVRGLKLTSGTLHIRHKMLPPVTPKIAAELAKPLSYVPRLRTVSVSTVTTPWKEGKGLGDKMARPGDGATANWAIFAKRRWAGRQSSLTDATFGLGNSQFQAVEVRHEADGWIAIDVPASIVQALANGGTFGLALFEEKGKTQIPYQLYTRESASKPYLEVRTAEQAKVPAPAPANNLKVAPAPQRATLRHGAASLSMSVAAGTSRVEVSYRTGNEPARKLEMWRTPLPPAGGGQMSILVTDLPAADDIEFEVTAIGAGGAALPAVRAGGRTSAKKTMPPPLRVVMKSNPTGEVKTHSGKLRVWAYGDCESAHPVTGNLLEEVGLEKYGAKPAGKYRRGNLYWNGRDGVVTLAGSRNEILAFQLLLESTAPTLKGVKVRVGSLSGPEGFKIPAKNVWLFRQWYVKQKEWMTEICIPLEAGKSISIPNADNKVPGQRNQSIMVDLWVPKQAPAGKYRGEITISADGVAAFAVPIEIEVWPLELPDKLSFNCELNAYSQGALTKDRWLFRLAHAHRMTLNVLPYSQSGTIKTLYDLPMAGEGKTLHVTDWSKYDEYFGPLFDGSAFKDMPRAGVPLESQYLPFFENWPLPFRKYYAFTSTDQQEHSMTAGPIEKLMDQQYVDGFKAIVKDFARHFREKGWKSTDMQFYLNNKPNYTKGTLGFWCLDEPQNRDDFLAIKYWGVLFQEAVADAKDVRFIYRGDISRPHRDRNWFSGVMDLLCASSAFRNKNVRCREMMREGMAFYNYGSLNGVGDTNLNAEAWPVNVYLLNGDGLLPWNTIGKVANYRAPSRTAILLPPSHGARKGEWVCSVRLKALRRGQQDVEYLVLLAKGKGYDREQIAALLKGLLDLKGKTYERFLDEAGETVFKDLSSERFAQMRAAIAAALSPT